mgnify:CR=1 FL=1
MWIKQLNSHTFWSGKLWVMKNKLFETPRILGKSKTEGWFCNSEYMFGTMSFTISGLIRCWTFKTSQCIPLRTILSNNDISYLNRHASLKAPIDGFSCWWSPAQKIDVLKLYGETSSVGMYYSKLKLLWLTTNIRGTESLVYMASTVTAYVPWANDSVSDANLDTSTTGLSMTLKSSVN